MNVSTAQIDWGILPADWLYNAPILSGEPQPMP
jgi:hypothetical protein